MSEHSVKRPRLTGSFSPASPPYHQSAKPADQTKPVIHPNTPTSPPYPPMDSHSNGAFSTGHTAPASEMTPPSSVNMSQQMSPSAASASNHSFLATPNSTAGAAASSNIDSEGNTVMGGSVHDDAADTDGHRRSDHDRQSGDLSAGKEAATGSTGGGSGLFKLCQSSHPARPISSSMNLLETYGLGDLALSVARTDPVTGEKINKMRKSYENHIKTMQISGKPKAVKMPGLFREKLPPMLPDEVFDMEYVRDKEYDKAIDMGTKQLTSDFDAFLNSAFAGMAPGPLPTSEATRYRAYLGTDDTSKPKAEALPSRVTQPPRSATPTPAQSQSFGSRGMRPERSGSKRSYTDRSFQGYGEGFTDDGYTDSPGGDDGQGGVKRRKLGFERTPHSVEVGGQRR